MAPRKILVSWMVLPLLVIATGRALPGEAVGKKGNLITGMEVQKGPGTTTVLLRAQSTPVFTVFKLRNPDRLVVDLLHAALAESLDNPRLVNDARVGRIATSQFRQAGNQVSRVIIGLKDGVRFEAKAQGNAVVVTITDAGAVHGRTSMEPSIARSEHEKSGHATLTKAADASSIPKTHRSLPVKTADEKASVNQGDYKVVESFGDKDSAGKVRLRRISNTKDDSLIILTDGPIAAYDVLEVYKPFRLVLDLYGARSVRKHYSRKLSGHYAKRLRVAAHGGKTRLVMDMAKGRRQPYRIERTKHGLRVLFGVDRKPEVAAKTESGRGKKRVEKPQSVTTRPISTVMDKIAVGKADNEVKKVSRKEESKSGQNKNKVTSPESRLKDLTFKQDKGKSLVVFDIEGESRPEVVHSDEKSTVLRIPNCKMPILLERTLDTSEFGGAVKSLSAYRIKENNSVKIVAITGAMVPNHLERREGKLQWVFESERRERSARTSSSSHATPGRDYTYSPDEVAGYSVRRPQFSDDSGGGKKRRRKTYTGRRISLHFKDADIHNILGLISDVARINIIASDDVKGKITISMRNVPWDQALDIILKTKKLGKVRHGNIIRIAPLAELAKEQELAAKAAEAKKSLEPLRVRIISVNYANAASVMPQVKDILSDRGSVTVDKRTNVLIVKDVLENLVKAEGLVRTLDAETPQVLIEARIVEANTQYLREVGIQWGPSFDFSSANNNPTGLPFPSDVRIKGGADDNQTVANGTAPGIFAINMPAAVGSGSGGALGFVFGSIDNSVGLNLRLSALENKGAVKIISAPKITTLDNNKAKIGQGVSIPISVVSAAGVNTTFIEAKLELSVTPHITQDGSVLLEINVKKNEPDFSRTGAKGDPTILKKEAETQVLVRDGDTTVIGGIYTKKTSDTVSGVPILSNIPILGWFFRNKKYNDERTELLIFITPRIVNRLQSTVSKR